MSRPGYRLSLLQPVFRLAAITANSDLDDVPSVSVCAVRYMPSFAAPATTMAHRPLDSSGIPIPTSTAYETQPSGAARVQSVTEKG